MTIYKVNTKQNIVDVCLQVYGTTELLFAFAKANDLDIDSDIEIGQTLVYDETLSTRDKSVLEQISKKTLIMNNQLNPNIAITEGIGVWIIESTFEIS